MIIRRKMPRITGRRSLGKTGAQVLKRSVSHVRRMVVSRLPDHTPEDLATTLDEPMVWNADSGVAPTQAPPAEAPPVQRDAAPSSTSLPAQSTWGGPQVGYVSDVTSSPTMPNDLQRIFNRHKDRGHVSEGGGIQRLMGQQRQTAIQKARKTSKSRIVERPKNVHYEPPPKTGGPSPNVTADRPPGLEEGGLPMPVEFPTEVRRVRSRVEYVNVSSPDREDSSGEDSDAESEHEDLPEDDLPDALPGTFSEDFEPVDNLAASPSDTTTPTSSVASPALQRSSMDRTTLDEAIRRAESPPPKLDIPSTVPSTFRGESRPSALSHQQQPPRQASSRQPSVQRDPITPAPHQSAPPEDPIQRADTIQRALDTPSPSIESVPSIDTPQHRVAQHDPDLENPLVDIRPDTEQPSEPVDPIQRAETIQQDMSAYDPVDVSPQTVHPPPMSIEEQIQRAEQPSAPRPDMPPTSGIQRDSEADSGSPPPSMTIAEQIQRAEQPSAPRPDMPPISGIQRESEADSGTPPPLTSVAEQIQRAEQPSVPRTDMSPTSGIQRESEADSGALPSMSIEEQIQRAEQPSAPRPDMSPTSGIQRDAEADSGAPPSSMTIAEQIQRAEQPSVPRADMSPTSGIQRESEADSGAPPSMTIAEQIQRAEQPSVSRADMSPTSGIQRGSEADSGAPPPSMTVAEQIQRAEQPPTPRVDMPPTSGIQRDSGLDSGAPPPSMTVAEQIQRAEQPSVPRADMPPTSGIQRESEADSVTPPPSSMTVAEQIQRAEQPSVPRPDMPSTPGIQRESGFDSGAPPSSMTIAEQVQRAEQPSASPSDFRPTSEPPVQTPQQSHRPDIEAAIRHAEAPAPKPPSARRITVSRSQPPVVQRLPAASPEVADTDDIDMMSEAAWASPSPPPAAEHRVAAETLPAPGTDRTATPVQRDVIEVPGESSLPRQSVDLGQALMASGFVSRPPTSDPVTSTTGYSTPITEAEPILMPPIGRARHPSPSPTPPVQRSASQSVTPPQAPAPPPANTATDVELLNLLNLPADTPIQRSGPPVPTPSSDVELPAIQREETAPSATAESTETGEAGAGEGQADVEKMARKVYKILQRRFRIERERERGRR